MTTKEFIEKWNVGYEDKEQQMSFAREMESDLNSLKMADFANQVASQQFLKINSEDVKKWHALLVGYGEDFMKKAIKETAENILTR